MSHVLVLISNPVTRCLSSEHVAAVSNVLPSPSKPDWLNKGVACQILFDLQDHALSDIKHRIKKCLGKSPIDVALIPQDNRRKKLLVADMDSTMIEQECIDEIADILGLKDKVAAITERAMLGQLPFDEALKERAALLVGVTKSQISNLIKEKITLTAGGPELVATMAENGAMCALVSGGFTAFTSVIGAKLGFHEMRANTLGFAGEALDGTVGNPILGPEAKLAAMNEFAARVGGSRNDVIAVGDGANDIAMLRNAGLGVAFHAKPLVAATARIQIGHADLTALLYVQGYRASEFASPK